MGRTRRGPDEPILIKKYANRRLYDTGRSSYVTLDDLCEMIQEGLDFVVEDAKSGEDLTRSVLTQIIVEQESRGENLLPTNFLRQLIGFYGDNIQGLVPNYLEQSFDVFVKNQSDMRSRINKSLENINMFPGVTTLDELNRKNLEIFEKTMKMFTPFNLMQSDDASKAKRAEDIKESIDRLQKELKELKS